MYFNPTSEQVAAAKASTCGMATPKDPSDCHKRCGLYNGKPCTHYRPREPKPAAAGGMTQTAIER
jgi:hypothetical protein